MMYEKKFDPKKLQKMNNPKRLIDIIPEYICNKLDIKKPDVLGRNWCRNRIFQYCLSSIPEAFIYVCV